VTDALQERERIAAQRQKEEEVMARQRRLDEAAIRAEQRQAIGSGMMAADRLAGMTMPGATPLASMQPTLRQKIGDTEYVYSPEMARAERHRTSVMEESLRRAAATREQTARDTAKDTRIKDLSVAARAKGKNSPEAAMLANESRAAYDALFPEPRQQADRGLTELQKLEQAREMDEAEAIFNTEGLDPAYAAAISSTYKSLRRAYPSRPPRELIYMAVQGARGVKQGQGFGGRFSPLPTGAAAPAANPATPEQDEFDIAVQGRK
jgi:hypothetical protein